MARQPQTLMQTGERVAEALRHGDDPFIPIRDFVDDYRRALPEARRLLSVAEPAPTGDIRFDAYLAPVAEHFAREGGYPPPAWVEGPGRFLDGSWFREPREHFWPMALVQTPLPFRRRLIFIEDSEFDRV